DGRRLDTGWLWGGQRLAQIRGLDQEIGAVLIGPEAAEACQERAIDVAALDGVEPGDQLARHGMVHALEEAADQDSRRCRGRGKRGAEVSGAAEGGAARAVVANEHSPDRALG